MLEVIASVIIIITLNYFFWIHVENNFYITFKTVCMLITLIYKYTITTNKKTTMNSSNGTVIT